MQIFFGELLEWNLSISPERVFELLKQYDDAPLRFPHHFSPCLKSNSGAQRFYIQTPAKNGFSHNLVGTVSATQNGSSVKARFRLRVFPFAFLLVWLSFSILIIFGIAIAALVSGFRQHDFRSMVMVLPGIIFVVVGSGMFAILKAENRGNESAVRDRICNQLDPFRTTD